MPTLLTAPRRDRRRADEEHSSATLRTRQATDPREHHPLDVALTHRVQETFRQSPYRRLHLVSTEVRNGVAVLEGRVPSFHIKQVAHCLLSNLEGLRRVENRLEVAD